MLNMFKAFLFAYILYIYIYLYLILNIQNNIIKLLHLKKKIHNYPVISINLENMVK